MAAYTVRGKTIMGKSKKRAGNIPGDKTVQGDKPITGDKLASFAPVALAVMADAFTSAIGKTGSLMWGDCRAAAYDRINYGLRAVLSGNIVALATASCGRLPSGGCHIYQATAKQLGVTYEGAGRDAVAIVKPDSPIASLQARNDCRIIFNSNSAWHKCTYTGLVAGSPQAAAAIVAFIADAASKPGDAVMLKQHGQYTSFAAAGKARAQAQANTTDK